ncbi:ABC transporter ATP-binding protein [Pseudoprimorskyibacter insulae]|uniref:Maltose/maltodextrin import ATP-binding protein MalK n=1 Tax=Pseudoprimorskyibacter insulae TaxID=1695997 RepID=A0A2R8AN50_9RHOB|nr:sn-glycerol-3-phosphate ABC transporter ATP-binding protein UgpC [Pseudoprimorskyibacter insulae]SPF77440.1 Maltose/maltodextrin import ATP-binding protein MalK [Pseudoprimorskyibacter insulae]
MESSISIRDLSLSFGAVKVLRNLNIEIGQGEFLVLLGSSGCGKSTLLNCIAGLLDVTDGQIFIQGKNVTWAEPSDRGIGMVFQSYALYPQMTVEGNLSFGLKNAGMAKDEIKKRVARAAEILQIEPLLKRKPAALSGGQRQRVAIGRALVRDVDVFLFDEPLSNLDAKLRADLRVEIKRLHQRLKNTMIYVTHDQVEALTLADRIAIMKGGNIQQLASPNEIYNKPANKYVADFIGSPSMNFLEGVIDISGAPQFNSDVMSFDISGYEFVDGPTGGPAWFGIRPEHIVTGELLANAPVQFDAEVELVEPMGSDTLVWAKVEGVPMHFRMDGQAEVRSGDQMRIGFDPARANIFNKETELRI